MSKQARVSQDSKVREGETATDYQLREGMPIWKEWANDVLLYPNVMPQYYDFRGHKPLLGNGEDFRRQLREVACLPKTNLNGAPNAMFITSFNEWWEGTQIEPENGSSKNWNNYGFDYMNALADFKPYKALTTIIFFLARVQSLGLPPSILSLALVL